MNKRQRPNPSKRMTWTPDRSCLHRQPSVKEISLADADFDVCETTVLEIARCYWQTFAYPASQAWLSAFQRANQGSWGHRGGVIGLQVLEAVQAMRMSRTSCFHFSNPDCKCCSAIVSEHERHFMNVFRSLRDGRVGPARTHAMILCEGNDTGELMERMSVLVCMAYEEKIEQWASEAAAQIH